MSGTGYSREITVMKHLRVVKTRTRRPSSFRLLMPDTIQMRAFYTVLRDDLPRVAVSLPLHEISFGDVRWCSLERSFPGWAHFFNGNFAYKMAAIS